MSRLVKQTELAAGVRADLPEAKLETLFAGIRRAPVSADPPK
jgi:hypothetical protein